MSSTVPPVPYNAPVSTPNGTLSGVWAAFFRQLVSAVTSGGVTTGNLTDVGTDGIVVTGGTGAVVGTGTSIAQQKADASHNGYLSSTDWSTFNGKGGAITTGNLTAAGTDGIAITGGTGAAVGTGTSIAQHVADSTHNGYLTSTDWSTFNGKQAGPLTGDVTTSGAASTLATVNSNVGAFTNASVTVNAKGLVTAASSGATPVTSVSVASANGLAGTSSGGATPALTLSTSINGVVKGNGTAFSVATSGTDYSAGTSGLATGILKSTTTTGALTIAVAADFPTLNQNTSGTAAGLSATLAIASGGTNVTSVTTSPAASSFAGWDANSNLSANNHLEGYATTATTTGTTTLLVGSAYQQVFTGTTTQTVKLPVASTLALGHPFQIVNNSSGVVTVQSSGGNTIQAMAANTVLTVGCILTSGTGTASWNWTYSALASSLPMTNPMTTGGDVIYGGASGTPTRLANGTSGQVLTSQGTTVAPQWVTPSAPRSYVFLTGTPGFGSTNTSVRRYSTTQQNVGSNITYADSATLGATFTVGADGIFAISATDFTSSASGTGAEILITKNSTTLTGGSVPAAGQVLATQGYGTVTSAAGSRNVAATVFLAANDVIRIQWASNNFSTGDAALTTFLMTQVSA